MQSIVKNKIPWYNNYINVDIRKALTERVM